MCAAYTLTDTMRGAADSLSPAAYDGTDAVVTAQDRVQARPPTDSAASARRSPPRARQVRATPGVAVAVGDVTDEAKIIGARRQARRHRPVLRRRLRRAHARAPSGSRRSACTPGRWATGPGQVVIDRRPPRSSTTGSATRSGHHARRGRRRSRVVGIATLRRRQVARHGAPLAVFDLRTAQALFAKDGRYDRILVARPRRSRGAARRSRRGSAPTPRSQPRAADDRFTLDSLKTFIEILRTILLAFAGVAVLVGGFTIFNSLSITVAQRTREFGLLRMVGADAPPGARARCCVEALVARRSARRSSASASASGSPRA